MKIQIRTRGTNLIQDFLQVLHCLKAQLETHQLNQNKKHKDWINFNPILQEIHTLIIGFKKNNKKNSKG